MAPFIPPLLKISFEDNRLQRRRRQPLLDHHKYEVAMMAFAQLVHLGPDSPDNPDFGSPDLSSFDFDMPGPDNFDIAAHLAQAVDRPQMGHKQLTETLECN